jgi:putative protein kinase ArgK-like GTPase of G3E family
MRMKRAKTCKAKVRPDGRTRLARALRQFEAQPTRETAQSLLRLLTPVDGQPWRVGDLVKSPGASASTVRLAFLLSQGPSAE